MKVLLIELNEFNPKLFRQAVKRLKLNNLRNLLDLKHCETFTEELKEFEGLDPWTQWPSIHYGKPFSKHKIKALGHNTVYDMPQMWDLISKKGFKNWIVIGAMNAIHQNKDHENVFIPDPWSYKEMPFPSHYGNLISLPRYVSKNYSDINYLKAFPKLLKTIFFFLRFRYLGILFKIFLKIIKANFTCGLNVHSLTTLLDYTYTLLFINIKSTKKSNFSLLFLNHIAHLQHQFWINSDKFHPQMKFGLQICDECIGILLKNKKKDEKIFIVNAIRQEKNISNSFYIYRQKNPFLFLSKIGVKNFDIMQNMTNEGNISFRSHLDKIDAYNLLSEAKLSSGKKLFNVELKTSHVIFYSLKIKSFIKNNEKILIKDKSYLFYSLFDLICKRTGVHSANGDIFYEGITLPKRLANHELHDYIVNLF